MYLVNRCECKQHLNVFRVIRILLPYILIAFLLCTGCKNKIQLEIPNFPHNTEKQIIRELAVFYSPDDISANTSIDQLGYPDKFLFLLHRDHPQLNISMQTVPANRYIMHENRRSITTVVEKDPNNICCRSLWKMIMFSEEFTSWMELGNHGYSHSPPEDTDLDHHEFHESQTGCNFDHSIVGTSTYCNNRFQLAREAYEEIGLDNSKIIVLRFPGFAYTDAALRAALDSGFISFFGLGNCNGEWIELSDGREILNIPSFSLYRFYSGETDYSDIQHCVDSGGIINLFDHWWDMFDSNTSNYQIADNLLDYIEQNYGDKVWWPFGSEMALWLHFQKYANHSFQFSKESAKINSEVPAWDPEWRKIYISYSITLPINKRVTHIGYIRDDTNWVKLDETMYWQEGSTIYLNVPFSGKTTTSIDFSD